MSSRTRERDYIAVVGAGVVGAATGAGLSANGHRVVFCDCSDERIAVLRAEGLEAVDARGLAEREVSAYLISVPTPMTNGRLDLSCVASAAETVGHAIADRPGRRPLVVIRSTVPPGTTEHLVIPTLESTSERAAGEGFGVCVNPEFLRQTTAAADFLNPRLIVIGALDRASDRRLRDIYAPWQVPVVSTTMCTAEAIKYTANLFNATKISFFNEMEGVLHQVGADPRVAFDAVANAAEGMWNPIYGTRGLAPFGGACLPKDTAAFLSYAEELGLGELMPLLRVTIQLNEKLIEEQRAAMEVLTAADFVPAASRRMSGSLAEASAGG